MAGTDGKSAKEPLSAMVQESLEAVRAQVDRLAFGSISLTIHEGKVVQIDVTEKRRLA